MAEILERKDVRAEDTWDLTKLYATPADFEAALKVLAAKGEEAKQFQGHVCDGKEEFLKVIKWYFDSMMIAEDAGNYAYLNYAVDASDSNYQRMMGMFSQIAAGLEASISFIQPEIIASADKVAQWIKDPVFADYVVPVKAMLRYKEHTLSPAEEKILAMQGDVAGTAQDVFSDLTNVDMKFADVNGKPLTQSTYSSLIHSADREERKLAYDNFYKEFEDHMHAIVKLYYGSIKQDIFNARVRGFNTALEASLFTDDVPVSVYTNLIDSVHKGFPQLHRFYEIKRKLLGVNKLAHYDVYVPLVKDVNVITPFDEAVNTIEKALQPLGKDYVATLMQGLRKDRWCDRYENKGKRSGAFSSGSYNSYPYLLLNYKEDVLGDVFTLIHESGHSMHSYYSSENNPYPQAGYTIFAAEVASTFNENLLADYFLKNATDDRMKAYVICKQLDDIVATLFRQTMFAEFELKCHTLVEGGEPLTLEAARKIYRGLLEAYFGPDVELPVNADLEGLRIPHFYRGYYVYKYSTGISASIALSERVLNGGEKELKDYLSFLKSGGSKFPIEELKDAGVDMSTSAPVDAAVAKFGSLLDEFEKLMGI